jgi:hypothetical protein
LDPIIHHPDTVRLRQLDFVDVLINYVFAKLPPDGWSRLSDNFLAGLEGLPLLMMVVLGMRVYP